MDIWHRQPSWFPFAASVIDMSVIRFVTLTGPKAAPVPYKPELITCGPQAGKKPLGEIARFGLHQCSPPKCDSKTSKCAYFYEINLEYHATMKPPGPKGWKYDYVRIVPEKHTNGYGALPFILIEVYR